MTCEYPGCTNEDSRDYTGPAGNSLILCQEHYVEAVYPEPFGGLVSQSPDETDNPLGGLFG